MDRATGGGRGEGGVNHTEGDRSLRGAPGQRQPVAAHTQIFTVFSPSANVEVRVGDKQGLAALVRTSWLLRDMTPLGQLTLKQVCMERAGGRMSASREAGPVPSPD